MTPKQRVLKKHPGAWLWLQPQELYHVMPRRAYSVDQSLGCAETPREAWADAAKNIASKRRGKNATSTNSDGSRRGDKSL